MSGGHWEYKGFEVREYLERIGQDVDVQKRWPQTGQLLLALAEILGTIDHDMDWCLSGDTYIGNDAKFDDQASNKILEAALMARNPNVETTA